MLNRVERTQGNQLLAELTGIRNDLADLRQRQLVSGESGVRFYVTETLGPPDYAEQFTGVSSQTVRLRVTFHGDGSQQFPIMTSHSQVWVEFNNDPTPYFLNYDGVRLSSGASNARPALDRERIELTDDTGTLVWDTSVTLNGTVKVYLDAYAYGTSPGSLTVERIA